MRMLPTLPGVALAPRTATEAGRKRGSRRRVMVRSPWSVVRGRRPAVYPTDYGPRTPEQFVQLAVQLLERHRPHQGGADRVRLYLLGPVGLLLGEDGDAGQRLALQLRLAQDAVEQQQAVLAGGADVHDQGVVGLLP